MKCLKQLFVIVLFCSFMPISAQNVGTGEWDIHLPYNRGNSLCDGDGKIYVGTSSGVFSVSKLDQQIELYSTVNGLSDVGVTAVGYSDEAGCLVIGYAGGNIDLKKGEEIINIRDIVQAGSILFKNINQITIRGTRAYLACGFGIAVIDLIKEEIPTYVVFKNASGLELSVFDIEFADDGTIVAASAGGLFYYSGNGAFQDFGAWVRYPNVFVGTFNSVVNFEGTLYANYSRKLSNGIDNQDTVYRFNGTSWQPWDSIVGRTVRSLDVQHGKFSILLGPETGFEATYIVKNPDFTDAIRLTDPLLFSSERAITASNGSYWVADGSFGLINVFDFDKRNLYTPEGPFSAGAYSMAHSGAYLWVTGGGMSPSFSPLFRVDGVMRLDNNKQWDFFNTSNVPLMNAAPDFLQVITDPNNSQKAYASSFGSGVYEIVGNNVVARYDSSTTAGAISKSTGGFYGTSSISLDSKGALWVVMAATQRALAVRKPDGTWKSFVVPGINPSQVNYIKALRGGQVWVSVRGQGIFAIRHDNYNSISQIRNITTNTGSGGLPSNFVTSIVEDKDGEVWVGTENGFIIFYNPETVFSGSAYNGVQPVVKAADGNNEKLLDGVFVRDIAVDGGNRKWFATYGAGVYLISEDGYTIQRHFLKSNTPLISDNVLSVTVHPDFGNVYFGTERGIVSYRGDATEAENIFSDNVYAFPNPVRPEFMGPITITGLAADSELKITDISGQLIFQTKANGGTAVWNGNTFNGVRAKTGVYLVFAANSDGSEKEVTRILIMN